MAAFEQRIIVRSNKLKIKNKFKSVVEETENVVCLLQSCVSSLREKMNTVVDTSDERFFPLYKNLNNDIELYQDKLYHILASFEKAEDENNEVKQIEEIQYDPINSNLQQVKQIEEKQYDPINSNLQQVKQIEEKQCDPFNSNLQQVKQIEEKQCDPFNSNLQQVPSLSLNQTHSSQTFCKTVLSSRTSLKSSESFCSFHDDYSTLQSEVQQKNSIKATSNASSRNSSENKIAYFQQIKDSENTDVLSQNWKPESHLTSQSSSYQSLSSNINAAKVSNASIDILQSVHSGTFERENVDSFEQNMEESRHLHNPTEPSTLILSPSISIPSIITATLSRIISPDDFWMQLEDSKELTSFQTVDFGKKPPLLYVQPGDFCLALSIKVNIYYRAKVLTETSVDGKVEVFFIDFGSMQSVSIQNLRTLPEAAYNIPMRAIHCCLSDTTPVGGIWSPASIEKFKEHEGTCEVHVKYLNGGKYGVQMFGTIMGFRSNVSEELRDDGFAILNEESAERHEAPAYLPMCEISNQVSHDSGVSVTSNQRLSPCNERLCISSEMLLGTCISSEPPQALQRKTYPQFELDETEPINIPTLDITDLISFESAEKMYEILEETKIKSADTAYSCLRTADCNCLLHLVVSPPLMSFVEEDMMLVMVSNIVSPSEFYVNLAMEDSFTLDELQEQMTVFYKSPSQNYYIDFEDLREGMFCAGRFYQDQNWYRVKILSIDSECRSKPEVYVQYIDYGNKASIKFRDLRPLRPEFVQHPSFAMKCSLAGIVPRVRTSDDIHKFCWNEDAVEAFKSLTSFDRCLTAQMVSRSMVSESESVPVLLWDTVETYDLLINEALVERKVAKLDSSLLEDQNHQQSKEVDVLNQWDPMQAEFVGIENSYGVDADEIGIAISGYKQRDEDNVCKYFSLRGYCPNGTHCKYQHVPLAEGGVTRDQQETYSLDPTLPLPAPSSCIFIQVSAVISPGQFYSILPFGGITVDEVDCFVNRGTDPESWVKNEVRALFYEMNVHYSNSPFAENTTVALSNGSIVVAWRSVDSAWHRARIVDVSDITGPTKVFFVDFGDSSWVPRKKIREILPQYLHTPFQAVECHLSDIEPLGFEEGRGWSIHAANFFKELVAEEVLLAHITNRCGKVLHLTLRKTGQSEHDKISDSLVSAGFAQYRPLSTSKREESIYVPG